MNMWVRLIFSDTTHQDVLLDARPVVDDRVFLGAGSKRKQYKVIRCELHDRSVDVTAEGYVKTEYSGGVSFFAHIRLDE